MTDPPTVLAMAEALRIAREALTLTATESDCAAATEGCLERVPNAPGAWCDWCHVVVALARMDALVAFTPDPPEDPT